MPKQSAGIMLYRRQPAGLEIFLVHPGGPFWARKDLAAWSIPKGEHDEQEPALAAAIREFHEETGFTAEGTFEPLGSTRLKSGKLLTAWALAGNCDPALLVSNTCQIQWPPRSGRSLEIPEIDRGAWFQIEDARRHLATSQLPLLETFLALHAVVG